YWNWFLTQLGDDLELYSNSDFTFITDRHKGLLPAIKTLFPVAAHRKWEVSGIPCKHAVACIYDMADHGIDVGLPEAWEKNKWLTTLLPPKVVVPVGRPSKKRKRSAGEVETLVISGKIGRKGLQVSCSSCKGKGHNKRGCKANASNQQPSQGNATEVNASGSQPQPSQGFMGTPSASTPSARTPSATTLSART
ncbi:hypothetical protein Tco_0902418, partial [Tanacetum coccineum]